MAVEYLALIGVLPSAPAFAICSSSPSLLTNVRFRKDRGIGIMALISLIFPKDRDSHFPHRWRLATCERQTNGELSTTLRRTN